MPSHFLFLSHFFLYIISSFLQVVFCLLRDPFGTSLKLISRLSCWFKGNCESRQTVWFQRNTTRYTETCRYGKKLRYQIWWPPACVSNGLSLPILQKYTTTWRKVPHWLKWQRELRRGLSFSEGAGGGGFVDTEKRKFVWKSEEMRS